MRWYERMTRIDRRIIYFLITLFVILPFFIHIKIPQNVMPQTKQLFDFIDSIEPNDKAVMISFDYTPQTMPECHPMALGLLKQCFSRHIPVVGVSFDPQAPGLAVEALSTVMDEFNAYAAGSKDSVIYGRDYVFLGWKSGRVAAQLEMGENIAGVYPKDYFNNDIDSLPLMKKIKNYKDIAIVIIFAAGDYPQEWILYAQSRYGVKLGAGLTAVMAPKYYPFLQTGQFAGMISGMKGAAEYEKLVYEKGYAKSLGRAETGMNSQSLIHLTIILIIIIGNIGFFFARKKSQVQHER